MMHNVLGCTLGTQHSINKTDFVYSSLCSEDWLVIGQQQKRLVASPGCDLTMQLDTEYLDY